MQFASVIYGVVSMILRRYLMQMYSNLWYILLRNLDHEIKFNPSIFEEKRNRFFYKTSIYLCSAKQIHVRREFQFRKISLRITLFISRFLQNSLQKFLYTRSTRDHPSAKEHNTASISEIMKRWVFFSWCYKSTRSMHSNVLIKVLLNF